MKVFIFLAAVIVTLSFQIKKETIEEKDISGYWLNNSSDGNNIVFSKVKAFQDDRSGYHFISGGKMEIRQNSGWCGTPPISYKNYDGQWEMESDSVIHMKYQFWGGIVEERWKVVLQEKNELIVQSTYHEFIRGEKNYSLR